MGYCEVGRASELLKRSTPDFCLQLWLRRFSCCEGSKGEICECVGRQFSYVGSALFGKNALLCSHDPNWEPISFDAMPCALREF